MSRSIGLQISLPDKLINLQETKMVRCTIDGCKYANGFHCNLKTIEITDEGNCSGYTKINRE